MPQRVKILPKLWLVYFLFTIALVGFFFAGVFYFPVLALSYVIPALRGVHEKILRFGVTVLMRLQPWFTARVQVDVPGDREGDSKGVLFVSNHRSHLDVFLLLSRITGIRVLARSSLFRIPILGLMMRSSRQIRVERGRLDAWVQAMNEVGKRLRQGERVHVFPEMTRCPRGLQGVQPFTAGPFHVAIKENVQVVPVVFKNTDGVWPKGQTGLNSGQPVEVKSLMPLRARDFASADALRLEVVRRLEAELQ
jgi:1-acyl-sn-glycerol-3-phosphate acyltransferase